MSCTAAIEDNGYRFDLGPTFFVYPQILQEIFHEVGRDLYREVRMTKLDPQYRITFGAGGELNATPDLERMVAERGGLAEGGFIFEDDHRLFVSGVFLFQDLQRQSVQLRLPQHLPPAHSLCRCAVCPLIDSRTPFGCHAHCSVASPRCVPARIFVCRRNRD